MSKIKIIGLFFLGLGLLSFHVLDNSNNERNQPKTKVAIVPLFGKNADIVNNAYYSSLIEAHYEPVDSALFKHNLTQHILINTWITNLQKMRDKKLQIGYNSFDGLTVKEKSEIKFNCLLSDLLILPSGITEKKVTKINGSGSITIEGSITVVDLNTGMVTYRCEKKAKVKFASIAPTLEKLMDVLSKKIVYCLDRM